MSERRWQYLMVHHSASGPNEMVADIDKAHKARGWSEIGYHFVIERDANGRGHLKRGRSDQKTGAHSGVAQWNKDALGLCVVGYFHPGGPMAEEMSKDLYQDVLAAVVHVMRTYGIPANNLKFHREVRATACPGDFFPRQRLREDVAKALKG